MFLEEYCFDGWKQRGSAFYTSKKLGWTAIVRQAILLYIRMVEVWFLP
jgi:hypothetical protein